MFIRENTNVEMMKQEIIFYKMLREITITNEYEIKRERREYCLHGVNASVNTDFSSLKQ